MHGGYGFMVEYAIHLYVKRAKAVRVAAGRPVDELVETARRRWDAPPVPTSAAARTADADAIDFSLGPDTEAFRDEVRAFVAEHVTDELVERAHATGTMHDWGLHRALVSARLASQALQGPSGLGGDLAAYDRAMHERFGAKDLVSLIVQAFLARPAAFEYAAQRLVRRERLGETLGSVMGDLIPARRALDPRFLAALLAP